jgi:hypothetical protein
MALLLSSSIVCNGIISSVNGDVIEVPFYMVDNYASTSSDFPTGDLDAAILAKLKAENAFASEVEGIALTGRVTTQTVLIDLSDLMANAGQQTKDALVGVCYTPVVPRQDENEQLTFAPAVLQTANKAPFYGNIDFNEDGKLAMQPTAATIVYNDSTFNYPV